MLPSLNTLDSVSNTSICARWIYHKYKPESSSFCFFINQTCSEWISIVCMSTMSYCIVVFVVNVKLIVMRQCNETTVTYSETNTSQKKHPLNIICIFNSIKLCQNLYYSADIIEFASVCVGIVDRILCRHFIFAPNKTRTCGICPHHHINTTLSHTHTHD